MESLVEREEHEVDKVEQEMLQKSYPAGKLMSKGEKIIKEI